MIIINHKVYCKHKCTSTNLDTNISHEIINLFTKLYANNFRNLNVDKWCKSYKTWMEKTNTR